MSSQFCVMNSSRRTLVRHEADSDVGVLGNMLQILGFAVSVDDAPEVSQKRKSTDAKSEEEIKAQNEFCWSVGSALVSFAMNESMADYASSVRELRAAEVETESDITLKNWGPCLSILTCCFER
jgi:hypothetical protein